jgi:catechol 2,3-dioxygenase-like lactoylglutathione lyase family enzyme
MIDHVGLGVSDFGRSRSFYDSSLGAVGIERLYGDDAAFAGYGAGGKAFFRIGVRPAASASTHVAFTVPDRTMVDRFHAAGLAAGGGDNGGPGLRPDYHPNYYAAFILDPDGNNIEAVCHDRD